MKQLAKHETGEDDEVQPGQYGGQPLVIANEAAEAPTPGEVRSTTQRRGNNTKPRLDPTASGSLTTSSCMPCYAAATAGCSPV